jgi:hypothetical protein
MTLLLDTHVWLWAVEAPDKLGRRTKALLLKSGNDRLVSARKAQSPKANSPAEAVTSKSDSHPTQ